MLLIQASTRVDTPSFSDSNPTACRLSTVVNVGHFSVGRVRGRPTKLPRARTFVTMHTLGQQPGVETLLPIAPFPFAQPLHLPKPCEHLRHWQSL